MQCCSDVGAIQVDNTSSKIGAPKLKRIRRQRSSKALRNHVIGEARKLKACCNKMSEDDICAEFLSARLRFITS